MRQWYNGSIRHQFHLGISLLIICTVATVLAFSLLTLRSINVTSALISDQEMIINYDSVFNISRQSIARYAYSNDAREQSQFSEHSQTLLDITRTLNNTYDSAYVYSLHRVTDLYENLGAALFEEDDTASRLAKYNRIQMVCGTVEYLLPYAQSSVADSVSQRIRQLEQEQRTIMLYMISIVFVTILLSFFLVSRIVSRMIASLQFLTEYTRRAEREQWNEQVPQQYACRQDELGVLTQAMYKMSQKIHTQIQQLQRKAELEQEIRQKEREVLESRLQLTDLRLKMLQDQVKPHFLFNCLNMISKLAFIENAPRCQKATELISRYLREVLEQDAETSTLEHEFACLQDYCRIQEMRFGERFTFQMYCAPGCSGLVLPSMCMQPLVENAFIHGLDKCVRKGWIHCSATEEENYVSIRIEDNGAGLTSDRIQWIYREIENTNPIQSAAHHIGLIGTVKRLKGFFGPDLSINISSVPGQGTVIALRIPHKN